MGAHEWRKKGVEIAALGQEPTPASTHYGVYSPVRGEYAWSRKRHCRPKSWRSTSAPARRLAAVLARRGVRRIVADRECAACPGLRQGPPAAPGPAKEVELQDPGPLPPEGAVIVCNPPWVPARPSSPIEHAVYDEQPHLQGFLAGLAEHLEPGGEGWLILSDLAEHLGLRSREQLLGWIAEAGLVVRDRHDVKPHHAKAADAGDALHAARAAEVTSLWRLAAA